MSKRDLLEKAVVCTRAGKYEKVEKICRSILKQNCDDIDAMMLLNSALFSQNKYSQCETILKKILSIDADHLSSLNNLGLIYREYHKDFKSAEALFKKVIATNPRHYLALMNLGNVYCDVNQYVLAEECYQKAYAIKPEGVEGGNVLNNLGHVFHKKGDRDAAKKFFSDALIQQPKNTDFLRNLLILLNEMKAKKEAVLLMDEIMKLPDPGKAAFPVFSTAKRYSIWEVEKEARHCVMTLIRDGAGDHASFGMLAIDLLASYGFSIETLFEIHTLLGDVVDSFRRQPPFQSHEKAMSNRSRLKVGYLSGDFCAHVVNAFFRGLVNFYDRDSFEVYCYSNTKDEDATTEQYKNTVNVFIDIRDLSDHELSERIHADGIHLLIDLSGYTRDSRIGVMSYRPAPVQILYLGYPYTSGLSSVDYVISDPYTDGPKNAQYFTEKQLHLPESFLNFDRLYEQKYELSCPFERNGYITFGCLMNNYKLNPEVISLWSNILTKVPNARMILNHPSYDLELTRKNVLAEFVRHDIDQSRVTIIWEKHPSGIHLRYYNEIDIALDTFPLTGGTTTVDAVWMGVPVITLVGDIYPFRISYSILNNIGIDLQELIAFTEEEYLDKAVRLAENREKIKALHLEIPDKIKGSILCDPVRFTRQMERVYIEAWNKKFPDLPFIPLQSEEDGVIRTGEALLEKAVDCTKKGNLGQAKALCRELFKSEPENLGGLNLLGSIFLMEKNYRSSIECLDLVLSILPDDPGALNNRGLVYLEYEQDFQSAQRCFKRVLDRHPKHINALMNLGNIYRGLHQLGNAEVSYLKALESDPRNGSLLNNLGSIYAKTSHFSKAREYYRNALEILPDSPEVLANLMSLSRRLADNEEGLKLIPHVMKLSNPGPALFSVYSSAKIFCLWEEAKQVLPETLGLIYENRATLNSLTDLNLSLLSTPEISDKKLFEIYQKMGETLEKFRECPPFKADPKLMDFSKRLRIGYLSPDFHKHVVNVFFRGLINFHDRERFEIFCYSNTNSEDEITEEYKETADAFINVTNLSDRALAERIRADGIHFLVDLAGYTTNGRMGALSYRPAPIQMLYLGYPYTSGMSSIDYVISDPYLDGPNNAAYFTEQQLRLPESFITFGSLGIQPLNIETSYERNKFMTFGSLNNTYKLHPELILVWSRILKRVPNARMIINHPNCKQEVTRTNILNEFEKNGIEVKQIVLIWEKHPEGNHLDYYKEIDVVLDTFPLTGGTTTIDAVWMGIPVVTLVGEIYPRRLSYSILKNIGIDVEDLIAFKIEDYIEKAVALANNPTRVALLRQKISQSLRQSVLCDPFRFTKQMEALYIEGWNRKFPDQEIEMASEIQCLKYIPLFDGIEIAAYPSMKDLNTYVVSEQGAWFDPEYFFVQSLIQPGMHFLDLDAGIGCYTIPIAKKIGKQGKVWASTRSATEAQLLSYSMKHNDLEHIDLFQREKKAFNLDDKMVPLELSEIDFVRLSVAESVDGLLDSGELFFKENSPLVMFRIKGEDNLTKTKMIPSFKALDYDIYRFVVGLDLLVPFVSESDLDPYFLNLFACKKCRAEALEQEGHLIREITAVSRLPELQTQDWYHYLKKMPYVEAMIENWRHHPSKLEEWESYWLSLNLYAWSKDPDRTMNERYACLMASYGVLTMLVSAKGTLSRCLSLVRVMIDIGKREESISLLAQIITVFESGEEIQVNEPFLPLSEESASIQPGDRVPQWLFASVLKIWEKNRAFSSYFTGESSLPILEAIQNTGFYSSDNQKQIDLIRARFPQKSAATTIFRKKVKTC